ncbi:MAG: AccI family restriction endonuclease [Bacteroidota bacterium]|nr:AccI family restriction endonuclease [Bacteroidota bacterium]
MIKNKTHPFENILSVSEENLLFELRGINEILWQNFLLNPRRLRGSDFLMRWSQGVWSEHRLIEAAATTKKFFAIPYGPSGTAPTDNVREFELYFEKLETAGLGNVKRPDLLVFKIEEKPEVDTFVNSIGGLKQLPFIPEKDLQNLIKRAMIAVECENSLWVAEKMPDFHSELTPQKRLKGKLGLKKNAVLPTVIIKEEDRKPLRRWEKKNNIPIHIWHVFYDRAYGLAFNDAEKLIRKGLIEPTIQIFQAPGGAITKKIIYKYYYHYAYPLAISTEEPKLAPDFVQDKNGHILPYVKFEGGSLQFTKEALDLLEGIQ